VYVEEIPSGSKPIGGVGTSTAAFLGFTTRGAVGEPTLIFKWDDYQSLYGGIRDTASSAQGDVMGHSVSAFFQNGGTAAYIVRLAEGGAKAHGAMLSPEAHQVVTADDSVLTFTAVNDGVWGNDVTVRLKPKTVGSTTSYTAQVGTGSGDNFKLLEAFSGISLTAGNPQFIEGKINGVSTVVTVKVDKVGTNVTGASALSRTEADLNGGSDGGAAGSDAFQAALAKLEKIRDISILALPGHAYDTTGKPFVDFAVAHAQRMRNRVVIVDPPQGEQLVTENDVNDLSLPTSTYSTLYYPWLKVANPFYSAEKNPGAPVTVLVPPSGFAAGMWSRIDGRRGVWKAPAGVETALLGVAGLEFQVEDGEQDQLNPLGVNCIRKLPSFGPVIWGTRTLSTNADPEWRYVPVRRTAIFIEQSVYNGIQWAVFEPNDHRLWSSLRVNIDSFMNGLFRAGAFQGEKASDAYFVRCGLGDTMTQGDVDRGQVIVVVGFAPLKPAEFVIVRIQQKLAQ
jgi:phage tail sheath protein FI